MENFGILFAAAFGAIAAPTYCLVIDRLVRRSSILSQLVLAVAVSLLALFVVEVVLVMAGGVVSARELIGPAFFRIHLLLVASAAPSVGAALVLSSRHTVVSRWFVAAPISWVVGLVVIFFQISVADGLYGIDGTSGPYDWPS